MVSLDRLMIVTVWTDVLQRTAWGGTFVLRHESSFFFFLKEFLYFYYLFIHLFIYGCVGSSFLCEGFLQSRQAGATLHRGARASHCRGLSCCGAQAPDVQAQ